MDLLAGIFGYRFLAYAFLASLLSGVVCGIIGTYVVSRRLVFLSGGITHASFGGIGIAYFLGLDPIVGATVFALGSASATEWLAARGRIREDSAIGIMWSLGMAAGVVFVYLTPGYAPNMMSFLFGNMLTVTVSSVVWLAALAGVLLVTLAAAYRQMVFIAFDRDYARSQRLPVTVVSQVMMLLVAMTIVLSIRAVGIVLLISLLTFPAVIANSFTKSYGRMTLWAVAIAVLSNLAGLWISYRLDIPAGATTIFVLAIILAAVKLLTLHRRKRSGVRQANASPAGAQPQA